MTDAAPRHRRLASAGLALAAALVAGGGLAGCQYGKRAILESREATIGLTQRIAFESEKDRTIVYRTTGAISVNVDSFGGSVEIEADPDLTETYVTVTRVAKHGWGRTDDARRSLREIDATVELVPGPLGQELRLRAVSLSDEPHFQALNVVIETPAVRGVRVHTENGDVEAFDVEGPIDIRTSDGDVKVLTNRRIDTAVQIINDSGDVDFRVRGESMGRLDLAARRGEVFHNVREGIVVVHAGTTHDRILATYNRGDNPIVLRAADGDVRFASVENARAVGRFIFD